MNLKDAIYTAITALEELAKVGNDEAADALEVLSDLHDQASPRVGFCKYHDEVKCNGCLGCQC